MTREVPPVSSIARHNTRAANIYARMCSINTRALFLALQPEKKRKKSEWPLKHMFSGPASGSPRVNMVQPMNAYPHKTGDHRTCTKNKQATHTQRGDVVCSRPKIRTTVARYSHCCCCCCKIRRVQPLRLMAVGKGILTIRGSRTLGSNGSELAAEDGGVAIAAWNNKHTHKKSAKQKAQK